MVTCAGELCGSTRVQSLPLYEATIEKGSSRKEKYAQPDEIKGAYGWPLVALAFGIVAVVSGAVLGGLLVAGAGAAWIALVHRQVEARERKREEWLRSMICLQCEKVFVPAA